MDGLGDGDDIPLEQAARVGVGQHDRGDIGREALLHLLRVDGAIVARRHFLDAVAEKRGRRRVGAVGGGRDEHDRAGIATGFQRGLDRHHAAEFAMGAGLGADGHGVQAGELEQPAAHLGDQVERAGDGRRRLQRVDVGEAGEPRHLFVEARVVLHRARSQRIKPGVDGVVLLAEAHVVAHRLRLGEAGKIDRGFAREFAQTILCIPGRAYGAPRLLGEIHARYIASADLEEQRLLDLKAAVAGERLLGRGVRRRGGLGGTAFGQHA